MSGVAPNNAGRVTTREFFNAQLETNDRIAASEQRQSDERAAMELRIMDELKGVPTQVNTNTKEIDTLRKRSNINDLAVLIVGAVSSAVAAAIGRQ